MRQPAERREAGERFAPELTPAEKEEVEQRKATSAAVVHETVREEGEEELRRPAQGLAWSGLAAGLSMGFSLVTEALLQSHLPDAPWRPLISRLGYSVGFLIVILGRQQLFTENTLTVILPLMARRNGEVLVGVLRLWGIVLASNLLGAFLFAWVIGHTGVFEPDVRAIFGRIGMETMAADGGTIFLRSIFSGWLIALMVWLLPVAQNARVPVIIILTYVVGLAGLNHIVAGSVDTFYLVAMGQTSLARWVIAFALPTLVGNVVGGVTLVAAINHAQAIPQAKGEAPSTHATPARRPGERAAP